MPHQGNVLAVHYSAYSIVYKIFWFLFQQTALGDLEQQD